MKKLFWRWRDVSSPPNFLKELNDDEAKWEVVHFLHTTTEIFRYSIE